MKEGATTCGVTAPLWSEIARMTLTRSKPEDGLVCLEQVEAYNEVQALVFGLRSGQVPGMPHDKMHERVRRQEEAKGEARWATWSAKWGCPRCRQARVEGRAREKETRTEKRRAGRAGRRADREQWEEWEKEEREHAQARGSTRHVLSGECAGDEAKHATSTGRRGERGQLRQDIRDQLEGARKAVEAATKGSAGGREVSKVLTLACEAAKAQELGEKASSEGAGAYEQTLAGILPRWQESESGPAPKACTKAVKQHLRTAQWRAAKIVEQGREVDAAHARFVVARADGRGWMRAVFRALREQSGRYLKKCST